MAKTLSRRQSQASQVVSVLTAAGVSTEAAQLVSGNPELSNALVGAAQIFRPDVKTSVDDDRRSIAQPWQHEAYRHVNICGEARYAVMLFSSLAGRAELGIGEPQTMIRKPKWVSTGPEVEALSLLAPTVRERTKLIRTYMTHRVIAGECYLISRTRRSTDPGYIKPPEGKTWEQITQESIDSADFFDPDFDPDEMDADPNEPIWEIVSVLDLRRIGDEWEVRHDNNNWIKLAKNDPVIRMWHEDPENRREAWSPMRSLLPVLTEIEWLTKHIFTQVRSRLMNAGVWFLPENMVFPPPPPEAVKGGAEAIALMNDAQKFMVALAAASVSQLDAEDVSFPVTVMTDPAALANIDKGKLIQFWSEIDEVSMKLRSTAVRRFALGFDLPPEQILGSSGLAIEGSGGSAGSVNHWGEWAKEEQTISTHVEPALDDFVGTLTVAFLRVLVPNTRMVIAYGTEAMRLRQDRSKEALELYDRGLLKGDVALRENAFDPDTDLMDDVEFKKWLLTKIFTGSSATPDQTAEILKLLTGYLIPDGTGSDDGDEPKGSGGPRNLDGHPNRGTPKEDHEHNPAPYAAIMAACEVLVLRALEKKGNTVLNSGKRGKDRDRTTPPHTAHLTASLDHTYSGVEFDFGLADSVLLEVEPTERQRLVGLMGDFCAFLYNEGKAYDRESLRAVLS